MYTSVSSMKSRCITLELCIHTVVNIANTNQWCFNLKADINYNMVAVFLFSFLTFLPSKNCINLMVSMVSIQ